MVTNLVEKYISLIIGCQRSGTTLLRLILETHPQISVYEEPDCWDFLPNKILLQNEIIKKLKEGKKKIVFKAPAITEQLVNVDSLVHGLHPKYPYRFRYENQRLFFLFRDPRDVCVSLKKLKSNSSGHDWIDMWDKYIDNLYPVTIPQFNKKYSRELEIIKNSGKNSFYPKAALYWKIKSESFFKYDKLNFQQILIWYEDFVTFPEKNIKRICTFLDLEFHENMLKHHKFDHYRTNAKGITIGDTNTKLPIHRDSVKSYEKDMTLEEQDLVILITEQ